MNIGSARITVKKDQLEAVEKFREITGAFIGDQMG
jgi:hypothetical protein